MKKEKAQPMTDLEIAEFVDNTPGRELSFKIMGLMFRQMKLSDKAYKLKRLSLKQKIKAEIALIEAEILELKNNEIFKAYIAKQKIEE